MKQIESNHIEFKKCYVDDLDKDIIAFLNSQGGRIYIGIEDNGHIIGIPKFEQDDLDLKVANIISDSIYPNSRDFINFDYDDNNVLIINIRKGNKTPYYLRDKGPKPTGVYIRFGASRRQATEEEILTMIMESRDYSFEKDISYNQNLHFKYLKNYANSANLDFGEHKFKTLGIKNTHNQFTNLGLLVSDENPIVVKFAKYDNKMDFIYKREYEGSIVLIADRIIIQADDFNALSAKIPDSGGKRIEIKSYPGKSLREAIINAICHADYSASSNIKIEFFPDKVKISNPGGIYDATLDEVLEGKQTFRNPGLVNILMRLNFIENYGTGLARIFETYKVGQRKPIFYVTNRFFCITLPNLNYCYASNEHDESKNEHDKPKNEHDKPKNEHDEPKNEHDELKNEHDELKNEHDNYYDNFSKKEKTIIDIIKNGAKITINDMQVKSSFSRVTVVRILNKLKRKNVISYIGTSKNGEWILNEKDIL